MKKVTACLIILALMTGLAGIILDNSKCEKETDVVCSILELISPAVAYADTVGDPKPPPPPPIND